MKNLHKKISAVALIAVLGAPILSQGLVISSNSSLSNNNIELPYNELQNYMEVIGNEDKYKYFAMYIGSDYRYSDQQYSDKWEFLKKGLREGKLNQYRNKKVSIIIKVGKSYFEIFYKMPKHKRDRLIVEECARIYSFEIKDYLQSSVEMDALIRSKFKSEPDVMKKLLNEKRIFPDGKSFRSDLSSRKIKLQSGQYYRFIIGDSDYIFYKK